MRSVGWMLINTPFDMADNGSIVATVLMDGSHGTERCEEVTGVVLHTVFYALFKQGVAHYALPFELAGDCITRNLRAQLGYDPKRI